MSTTKEDEPTHEVAGGGNECERLRVQSAQSAGWPGLVLGIASQTPKPYTALNSPIGATIWP